MNDFTKWQSQLASDVELYTEQLYLKAKSQAKTYNDAIRFLQQQMPELPNNYNPTAKELQKNLVRQMYQEARNKLIREAKNARIQVE